MIVGRDEERGVIADLLSDARSGRSGVLVLRGEAGVGKSTMLRAAVDQAQGMALLSCSGVESEIRLAFSGLHQLLGEVLDRLDELPDVQAAALRGALGLSDDRAAGLLVSAGVLTLLATVAEQRPLLIVVDDAHWLDESSAAVLLFAFRRLLAEPIAALIAVRDPEPNVFATGDLPELRLGGLKPGPAAALLDQLGWQGAPSMRDMLVELTAGNPLALSELVRSGHADEIVEQATLAGTVPLSARLQTAFIHGVDQLPADTRSLLLVAATEETGRRDTVLGAAARLGVPAAALDAVERAELVESDGRQIRFRHPLIRSAVAAERFPGLFVYRADGGCRARVEHEQRRLVLLDQGAGGLRVGRVGDNRDERRTQPSVHVLVTLVDQRGGDRRSEAAARSGDHRRGL